MKIPKRMFKVFLLTVMLLSLVTAAMAADDCEALYGKGDNTFTLATGSPGELGLLEVMAEAFNKVNNTSLCWKKAGSGASLKLLKQKQVDMVMVHAPAAEKEAVKEGWATKRHLIGSNEFYIVGPKAAQFIDFVISEEGQNLIRNYGADQYGEGLYNDAAYAKQYDD